MRCAFHEIAIMKRKMEKESKMNLGKAIAIFKRINSDDYSDDQKLEAIKLVADMETHNSITKADILNALKWVLK